MIFKSMTPDSYYSRHLTRDTLTLREAVIGAAWSAVAFAGWLVLRGVWG